MKNLFTPAYFYRGLALTALLAAGSLAAQAQGVRIGTAGTPDASAILDLVSGTKGALLPRVAATADVTSPAAPPATTTTPAPLPVRVGYSW